MSITTQQHRKKKSPQKDHNPFTECKGTKTGKVLDEEVQSLFVEMISDFKENIRWWMKLWNQRGGHGKEKSAAQWESQQNG